MMNTSDLAITAFFSLLPISELRGAIPLAVARGMPLLPSALWCIVWNAMAGPIAFLFLGSVHKLLHHWKPYAKFFDGFVERARIKVHPKVERYGYLGLMLFVAIPFPLTGAWTGVLGGWILGMDRKRVLVAVAAGVFIAGTIVTAILGLGIGALSFLMKRV